MAKQQLYIKNDKGRYEPYREPEPPYDNCLYRKIGKKYEPTSMCLTRDLPEGVWVVTKNVYGRRVSSGIYLRDCFMCQKASDIQEVSLAELGGLDKLADHLFQHFDEIPKNKSIDEICRAIVGILSNYKTGKEK